MTTFRRLLGLTAGQRRWIAVGALLGFLAVASSVALMEVSAFLISKAAIVSNVAEVALAITAVRVLAIGRGAFRYFERTVACGQVGRRTNLDDPPMIDDGDDVGDRHESKAMRHHQHRPVVPHARHSIADEVFAGGVQM